MKARLKLCLLLLLAGMESPSQTSEAEMMAALDKFSTAYNRFAARSQMLLTRYYAFGNELQVRLHRQLHGTPMNLAAAA